MHLGGGRRDVNAKIDPKVGLSEIAKIGAFVEDDAPLCMVHAGDADAAGAAAMIAAAKIVIAAAPAASASPTWTMHRGASS